MAIGKTLSRKKVPTDIETAVLIKSARRCPVCFHMDGDLRQKPGQIAHLDKDPSNWAEHNLAWVCLPHHSEYDSTTSQHKNYTIAEIKEMRRRLFDAIAEGQHLTASSSKPRPGGEADRQTLKALLATMAKSGTIDWLRGANFAGWSFEWGRLDGVERFIMRKGPEHEFIDATLEKLRKEFYDASKKLVTLLATETFPVGNGNRQAIPEDWELEQPDRFKKAVHDINTAADMVCTSYDQLVRTAKKRLLP
jgi:hypothetical protein